ncbi:hypothetical protein [Cellvibrio sp. UBA7661]|uniref:hypothetical protein n=1 Tax=Cellvibrio sp. UBA7661 TaxID=1946311 RepID=UPI002F3573D0
MPKRSYHLAFLAFTFWLLSSWAGAHGHFCFDGQEPPISVHMHLDGHEAHDHHPDEVHQDADIELGTSVLAKLGKIDLGLILLAAVALGLLVLPARFGIGFYQPFHFSFPLYTRPPLRAPPFAA